MNTSEFFKPHNIFGYCLAAIGILLGAFFYYASLQKREPVYRVVGDISKIYDSRLI